MYHEDKKSYSFIVLLCQTDNAGWKYSLDSKFCNTLFISREKAMDAAFEALDAVIKA